MNIFNKTAELIYPPVCPFCERPVGAEEVCSHCQKELALPAEPLCLKCGKPIQSERKEYCRDCLTVPKSFETGGSLWIHKKPVSRAIYRFKYQNRRVFADYFAKELFERYRHDMKRWQIQQIIPIPLHWRRRMARGYNQSELIAGRLGALAGIPAINDVLVRRRATKAQKKLHKNERRRNMHQAFVVKNPEKLAPNVLLVDDIYTTGSTLQEAAKRLKKAGVSKVYFLTISIGQEY